MIRCSAHTAARARALASDIGLAVVVAGEAAERAVAPGVVELRLLDADGLAAVTASTVLRVDLGMGGRWLWLWSWWLWWRRRSCVGVSRRRSASRATDSLSRSAGP